MDDALTVAEPRGAEEAIRLAQADPHAARLAGRRALARARRRGDDAEASMAERALGLAAIELGDLGRAASHLKQAVSIAEAGGLELRAAQARMSLALALTLRGATGEALDAIDASLAVLDGVDAARARMQRAVILQKLGRLDEALDGYRAAAGALRRHGDVLWEARLLANRAVLNVYRGALRAAEADLRRAEALDRSLGQDLGATEDRHNLGWVAARRGDVPTALAAYDRAEEDYRRLGVPVALLLMDRCEVLLGARLVAEARRAAERAVGELAAAGMGPDLAEARLLLADAHLLAGDAAQAGQLARQAQRAFARQHRPAWAALARYAALRASRLAGRATPADARRTAAALADAGWAVAALDARLIEGQLALERGRPEAAAAALRSAAAARARGPAELRTRAWHAEALARTARGDARAAARAVDAGLRAAEAHRATLGSSELRAHASGLGEDVALLGVRLALDSRSPARVLAAAERWRAGCLLTRPVRPPGDERLAADLDELRGVVSAIDEAVLAGRPTEALRVREAALQDAVRHRARHATGAGAHGASPDRPPSLAALGRALGDRALVEFVADEDRLHAVSLAGGRARLHALGSVAAARADAEALRFGFRRLARGVGGDTVRDAIAAAAARLDAALLGPLRAAIGARELVLVPTGALHALPWPALPACSDRALTVAPSARLWWRAQTDDEVTGGDGPPPVLVAGPGLPHAAAEVAALRDRYPAATCLAGADAHVAAVAAALDGAAWVHLATHGRFRADNPLFSCLTLADGPLTVHDLERLTAPPARLILSSCESGLSAVAPGDELMGLTAALLGLGTATVVASVVPVPDDATCELMIALHAELAAGAPAAVALARARATLDTTDPRRLAAHAGFVCFGAG